MNIKIILGTNQALKNACFEDLLGHFFPIQNITFKHIDVAFRNDEMLEPIIESYIKLGVTCISFIEVQDEATILFLISICRMIRARCNKELLFVILTSPSFTQLTLNDVYIFPEFYFYN